MSTFYGYETFDAEGYRAVLPKVYYASKKEKLSTIKSIQLLKEGYAYFATDQLSMDDFKGIPLFQHIVGENYKIESLNFKPGVQPDFFSKKTGS